MADQDAAAPPNDDDREINLDRKVKVKIGTLQDVLGILDLDERASIPRRIATEARAEIRRAIARELHPSGTA
jgi:hypothetical protein